MDLTNIDDLRVALRLSGIKPAKGLGQHFLIDKDSLEAVLEGGDLKPNDVVLEIGPGLGVMTVPLLSRVAQVVAVETDPNLIELLQRDRPDNLKVVASDIMQFNTAELPSGYKVVANIPYYITSSIFRLLLESPNPPQRMSMLIQKEVAERITAGPGKMSVLALSVQYYGKPALTRVVERYKFWPAPQVDSAVLVVDVYDKPAFPADEERLFRLIKAGFGEKRKMLKNSLAGGLNISMDRSQSLLEGSGISVTARAQELSLEEWERLYRESLEYL